MGKTIMPVLPLTLRRSDTSQSHSTNSTNFGHLTERLQTRIGNNPMSGRYHRLPRKIQDDYDVSHTVLGTGYSGEVRMASSKVQSHEHFAVKTLKLCSLGQEQLEQLEAEVENFLCMDHPHITRLYDVYQSKKDLYLVMECMEGGELFERVSKLKRFSESNAADAIWQMLLALNYLHSHGIVHRDLKLENFLYDSQTSTHLKLIDFGFSKMWDPSSKMEASCGTLSYVAPEVLQHCYTSQCDLWSLGVISFILIGGYMPFPGVPTVQSKHIQEGKYYFRPEKWSSISTDAVDFVRSLLTVNPQDRLTAKKALEHPFIVKGHRPVECHVAPGVAEALRQYGHTSKFRRCCMEMIAWSLSNEERAKVREAFIAMDTTGKGTIAFADLRKALTEALELPEEEVIEVFEALDYNHDDEIQYSDFLAAMVSTQIDLNDELISSAFRKFDESGVGYITKSNLEKLLGETIESETALLLTPEADLLRGSRISYDDFVAYLRGYPVGACLAKGHPHRKGWMGGMVNKVLARAKVKRVCGHLPTHD